MTCENCGNQSAYTKQIVSSSEGTWEYCDRCGTTGSYANIPDVYLGRSGQQFQNLCDKMGRPYEIQSKRHKKEIMDKLGVREAGGTVNGAPFGTKSWIDGSREYRRRQFEKERPMIQKTLKEWKERSRASH